MGADDGGIDNQVQIPRDVAPRFRNDLAPSFRELTAP
jgi:hypothetical protein